MSKIEFIPNLPESDKKRVVVAGGGFAGFKLIRKLIGRGYEIVLLDKNNFHQFQPLLYQVATAGLEPSSISFPVRKVFQKIKDVHFRIAEIQEVIPSQNEVVTDIGRLKYDYLILSIGANTNYFGQNEIEENTLSMKTASDAILIRNTILEHFEKALLETQPEKIEQYLNIGIVGGGPTGVELAGALAEMKKYIFPKDYPELDLSKMRIIIYEAASRLLASMSEEASAWALKYLKKLHVEVNLNTRVEHYDGNCIRLSDRSIVSSKTVIWSAGIKANGIQGLPAEITGRGNRMLVDRYNRVNGFANIFAIGDNSLMVTEKYPNGHPQVAQAAIQQANLLSKNLVKLDNGIQPKEFEYNDKGSMATIGRNLAVADLPFVKLHGFIAWILWSFVHLFLIMGVKNRLLIFLNWTWNYFTYDQSLRLLIKPKPFLKEKNEVSCITPNELIINNN
ncbi:MAG: FAD-dependent oxidoreductase [Bacteroidetes bacterium CG18_big_fil_WC_8_21_14_2_50_41_14]|nr:MAG: FAD-dependent oxidoreductase [Bacteroidetes bacterium CG18_big_fil_WC_8_21_14_2_50_41_14]PJB56908.1 MAG: FAD-dependent oxidoreductase [Bacteroidetes bacterium CG_4_9_14_3_um_filter_41_19]